MITEIFIKGNTIAVETTTSANHITLPFIWFRDHCQCQDCLHHDTKQRQFNTFGVPEELTIDNVALTDAGKYLVINWKHEKHTTVIEATTIEKASRYPATLDVKRILWTSSSLESVGYPFAEYEYVLKSDNALKGMLEAIEEYGFCFVEQTPIDEKGMTDLANRIAYIRQTIFGGYYEMRANLEHKDTAYTPLAITPHTDGTYSFDAPSYQILHCIEENCVGGDNILVDGFKIEQVMHDKYPEDWQILTQVEIPGQYIDLERNIHLMAQRPLFRLGTGGKVVQISFNNHDRAPFILDNPKEMEDFYRALTTFNRLISSPEFHFRRKLQPGSCLVFDNWRILHAREAYTGSRALSGVYFNKEDVESKLRVFRNA